ncbi:ras and Rab interactor-like protein isoform X1 [Ochotona princeps]|uniref:ras and Rab interactor-like protein isoform X1 n=1 Tax=Ochotona princeps TaxID=9978 RepID=UPI002714D1C5|nr:ras and Rab interactor-like protein isoform X1 [Ochotona princeps]
MAQPHDKAVPTNGERLVPSHANGAGKTPVGVLSAGEPLLRLRRTQGVWQIPELEVHDAVALVELWPLGSFLVAGQDPSQTLVLKTGSAPGEVSTYKIQKLSEGVSLEASKLCMPDLSHLLAFLSASRDILPRTLLLPPPALSPGEAGTARDTLQMGRAHAHTSAGVLCVVNQLYLETHAVSGTEPKIGQRRRPATRIPGPHQVSWVEAPPTPKVRHLTLNSLEEEEQEEDDYQDEEKGPEDVLTAHVRALARARSSYVAGQYRGLRARLASCSGNPHRPGDPATELLQDVRNLLLDLQDHLAKDPSVRAILGSRGPRDQQKQKDLGLTVEAAVCRAVLAPLKPVLWMRLRTFRAPELRRLRRRQMALRAGAGPEGQSPALAQRSQIHERLAHLHAACAPRRKVALLLAVCSDVYAGLACGEGQEPQGADAFLPALTEELIWSPDIGETQLDVEFLMELLDPDELRGEAGYYLTTWFGALHHIAHYQPDAGRAPQGLSNEARASLHQWHRRRTLHRLDQTGSRAELPLDGPWAVEAEQGTCDN